MLNTVLSRKNSKDTPIINIQQRAGGSDATAVFQDFYGESDKAMFLVMPVIKDGVPLWRWKLDVDDIERLRTSPLTFATFETQYMQNPVPKEGLLLPSTELHYDTMPDFNPSMFVCRYGVADPADTGGDKFAVPFIFVSSTENGISIYVHDALCNTNGIMGNTPAIVAKCKQYAIEELYVESNGVGTGAVIDLHDKLPDYTDLRPVSFIGEQRS